MKKYKRYKLKYFMLYHGEIMTYTRLFRSYESMLEALSKLRKKDNYVKHIKYEVDITETEIE